MSELHLAVSFFSDYAAREKRQEMFTPGTLADLIRSTTAPAKNQLPWLKLARFGAWVSEKGSLRHDRNVIAVSGVEADYDGENISFEEVCETLEKVGLAAIVYTSPSHTEERPRWRVLCPFSTELPPPARAQMLGRLNGLLRGVLADESWALSQSYYYGSVGQNPHYRVVVLDGQALDPLDELDEIWLGKPQTTGTKPNGAGGDFNSGPANEAELLEAIRTGSSYHRAAARLAGLWARHGVAFMEARRRLYAVFETIAPADRDARWRQRHGELPRILDDIYGKDAGQRDDQAAQTEAEFAAFQARQPPPEIDDHDASTSWATPPAEEPWPEIEAEAFHGLAGRIVDALAPTTEADPVAILTHLLVEFGNAIGRHAYCLADGARHYPNEYAVIVGDTAKGRKGTAARRVEQIMSAADSDWHLNCVASGLSSGEGILHAVHDEIRGHDKVNDGKGKPPRYVEVVRHPGISDKRLLVHEPEFAGALEVMKRQGSTLSRVIREAYDTGNLRVLTKNAPEKATGAHVSILGHITIDEYRVSLDRTSMVNGYANRFLNVLAKRWQELPFGGALDEATVVVLADRVRQALGNTATRREITFDAEARELWIACYHDLSAAKPGLFGSVVARSEAHTLRLALLYALLDQSRYIAPVHLRAALAFWRYCEASARFIFADALGDPLADEIRGALRQAEPDGMSRWDLSNFFKRNRSSESIAQALALLLKHGKARMIRHSGGSGRPTEIWKAV
jgi:hypothetical protein